MPPATLGELFHLADAHLRAAAVPDADPGPKSVAAALGHAGRVARALSRYLDDILEGHQADLILNYQPGTQLHSALHARLALQRAAASFDAAAEVAGPRGRPRRGTAAELDQAAGCLIAGRDLLASHFITTDQGLRSPASWWSAVIGSAPAGIALLDQIAGQARQTGHWAATFAHVAVGQSTSPRVTAAELDKACRWLAVAASTATAPQRSRPVTRAQTALLQAIPASALPDRQPPEAGESASMRGERIVVTAERVRAWAYWQANGAPWRPALTADSWRWTATAAAVACDITEAVIVALSQRSAQLLGSGNSGRGLLTAVTRKARRAREAWREVGLAWGSLTTEVTGLTSPVIADTGDLVIRLGRSAFTDPRWTPARARQAVLRQPADLAPGPGDIAGVLAAVHYTADALAALAIADQRSVAAAISACALYVPARAMPEELTRTRQASRFWPALDRHKSDLAESYAKAIGASSTLAEALDATALRYRAPSQILAIARTAEPTQGGTLPAAHAGPAAVAAEWAPPHRTVAEIVRCLCGQDSALLGRAIAVDQAARQVMADAWTTSGARGAKALDGDLNARKELAARRAATVAGQNFPRPGARNPVPGQNVGRPKKSAAQATNARKPGSPVPQTRPALPK